MSTETVTPELLTELFTDWAQRDGILARITDRQQAADLALAFGAGFMVAQASAKLARETLSGGNG